jgi:xanthine dehydrogenase large subunit
LTTTAASWALDITLASRCGYSTDYSGPVNDRAVLHIDNCYTSCRNLQAGQPPLQNQHAKATAFRGFGGPQGMFGIETVIEQIANTLGKDPLEVRRLNLYKDPAVSGDAATMTTQYNQLIEDWVGDKVIGQVAASARYAERRASVAAFQRRQQTPQARSVAGAAEVWHQLHRHHAEPGRCAAQHLHGRLGQRQPRRHRNGPGSEHQNGTGVRRWPGHTGQPRARDRHRHAKGAQRESATSASSGADINGAAIMNACAQMRERLAPVAARMLGCDASDVEFVADYARAEKR